MMARRVKNVVVYYEYTVMTVDYDIASNAFTIARAVVSSSQHAHRLTLVVAITLQEVSVQRFTIEDAIARARRTLHQLVTENRAAADTLTASTTWSFNITGQRIR